MSATTRSEKILRVACVCAIAGLALVVWSVLDPRPAPVLLGLSVGQGLGILSFLGFGIVVAADLGVKRHIKSVGVDSQPPPAA